MCPTTTPVIQTIQVELEEFRRAQLFRLLNLASVPVARSITNRAVNAWHVSGAVGPRRPDLEMLDLLQK
jgi:hypothetical protein